MDEKADELAAIAHDLVTRVRDDDPADVHRWLQSVVNSADWMGLAIVLAAAVPDDKRWTELTAWTVDRKPSRRLRPCGTFAAVARHRYHGEPLCDECKAVDRQRKRDERKSRALSTAVDNEAA